MSEPASAAAVFHNIFRSDRARVMAGIRLLALGTGPEDAGRHIERLPYELQEEAAQNYVAVRQKLGLSCSYS